MAFPGNPSKETNGMSKTKIVCTIGPSSSTPDIIRQLIVSGMDVARLNFSHGTHEEHLEKIHMIRSISQEVGRPVAILQDLCGPKIRVGTIPGPGIQLEPGHRFTLTSEPVDGNAERVSVSYPSLPREVKTGDTILLADGLMQLTVLETTATDIHCKVITGGLLTSHKGINLPTNTIKASPITEKDRKDLMFGLENDVDYIALSFVKTAKEILQLKYIIEFQGKQTPVIAKIEKHEAIENMDEIMAACDGIMVARGDLGVEIPLEQVPQIQKILVRKANDLGKPVIIATQMLRSMVRAPRPTRAEATDVANAVLDGADAIMMSEETASGQFPVEAVQYMVRIALNAEKYFPHQRYLDMPPAKEIAASVAHASCVLANHLEATAIIATTRSGFTAKQISRFRPKPKLIAQSPDLSVVRKLALYWGCIPVYVEETLTTDECIDCSVRAAMATGKVSKGDTVVITTGHPVNEAGTTNMIRVKEL